MGIDFSHFDKGDYEFVVVIIAFIALMYKPYFSKLAKKVDLKPFLTKEDHSTICHGNVEEISCMIDEKIIDLKEFMTLKIKNEILTELRKE